MSTQVQNSKLLRVVRSNPGLKKYLSAEQQDLLRKNNKKGRFVVYTGIFSAAGAYFFERKTNAISKFVSSSRLGRNLFIFGAVPFVAMSFQNLLFKSRFSRKISASVRESLNANPEFMEAFENSLKSKRH